jgi:hypothetical protein
MTSRVWHALHRDSARKSRSTSAKDNTSDCTLSSNIFSEGNSEWCMSVIMSATFKVYCEWNSRDVEERSELDIAPVRWVTLSLNI